MNRLLRLWQTTTVRLTATFILIFVVFSVGLLAFIAYQSAVVIQRQQAADITREINLIKLVERRQGWRGVLVAVQRLSDRPGPGIYYLGDNVGQMLAGNVHGVPPYVLAEPGTYTFDYEREEAFAGAGDREGRPGYALVESLELQNGLRLVVGRDIRERRGFSAIILEGFLFGVAGIVIFSVIAGGFTAMRVLKRIDSITGTSTKIMSGSMSERVPVTGSNDEFDRLATSLNAMLDRIEQLMQGLKEVTDNVAHDLKTPLTRLRNKAEAALRDGKGQEGYRQALETTIEESDQLIRTFNALLMIARVEAGTPSGAFTDVNISDVVADVADLYAPVAEDAGIVLDMQPGEDIHLVANRELIGQALVNLLENAIKYLPPEVAGEKRIWMSAKREGGHVLITVADNGPGIPEDSRDHVIKRFVRLEKSRTEPGSGLGLSLVSAVARLHKGHLRLEDNKPGVRAVLDLPVPD